MQKKFWIYLMSLLVIPGLLLTLSCAKKTVKTDASVSETSPEVAEAPPAETAVPAEQERDRQPVPLNQGAGDEQTGVTTIARENTSAENTGQLSDIERKIFLKELVLFEYNRAILTREAQERLTKKANYLKDNPEIKVIIEGHCDERGTNEYNLALGERRAEATRDFLVDLGVSTVRLSTISYGEERPFALGSNESAWSLNRRAHFVVQ